MIVEISLTVPPDRNLVRFRVNDRQLSALMDLFMDSLEKNKEKYEQLLADLDESSTETSILERLGHKLTERQAHLFKELLKENNIQEQEICEKYGIDQISDLTGSDALNITVQSILPQMKRGQEQPANQ